MLIWTILSKENKIILSYNRPTLKNKCIRKNLLLKYRSMLLPASHNLSEAFSINACTICSVSLFNYC